MKILFIVKERKKTGFGGVETLMKNLSKELNKKGHTVDILSRQDDLKLNSVLQSVFPLRKKVKEIMKKERYDIIYTQDWNIALPLLFPYPLFIKKHFSVLYTKYYKRVCLLGQF